MDGSRILSKTSSVDFELQKKRRPFQNQKGSRENVCNLRYQIPRIRSVHRFTGYSRIRIIHKRKEGRSKKVTSDKWEEETLTVELNSADTTALKKINGIGSYYAKSIIEYRDRLGGFRSVEQLLELKYMREESYEKIKEFLTIDALLIQPIFINDCSLEDLKNHPYITYKQANLIINYRKQHGNYNSIVDLEKLHLLDKTDIEKIEPYLSFDGGTD